MYVPDMQSYAANRPAELTIHNARLVTPDGIVDGALLKVARGRISEIVSSGDSSGTVIDAGGAYLLPGFIDMHCDAIEKSIEPRPNTFFPVEIAAFELDKQLASCGITTIYHSLSFAELEVGLRNNSTAATIIRQLNSFQGRYTINTRVHARFEITDRGALPYLRELINNGQIHLLSFMDHSPGQGQFRDVLAFKQYYGPVYAKTDAEMDAIIERKLAAREQSAAIAINELLDLCREYRLATASHDDDSHDKMLWLDKMDIRISEFPINLPAAAAAHELGIRVCLGAPNVLRGQSQGGNLSAQQAIASGLGDILCSDYAPMTLLHAVFLLARQGLLPLHQAVNMASLHPARALGIAGQTGALQEGLAADMILVEEQDGLARVRKTFVGGREVFTTC